MRNFLRHYFQISIAGAFLVSCSDTTIEEQVTEVPVTEEISAPAIIPATDELGSFETPVSGLSLWNHPQIIYKSGVVAANGEAGLILISTESEVLATLEGNFQTGSAVSYISSAGSSKTVLAAFDETLGRTRLLTVETDPFALTDWTITDTANQLARMQKPACFAKTDDNASLLLLSRNTSDQASVAVLKAADHSDLEITPSSIELQDVVSCVADERTGEVFTLSSANRIYKHDLFAMLDKNAPQDNADIFLTLPEGDVVEIALIMKGDSGGQLLAMVSSGDYTIFSYDLLTAELTGTFTLGEFSDIAAVRTISAFAADGSNFGGLYREGVIAIVEGNENFALKLAPWTAVRNTLGLQESTMVNRRDIGGETSVPLDEMLLDLPATTLGDG